MANIAEYLRRILSARLGEEVRGSIHDSIKAMNDQIENDLGGMIEDGNDVIEAMQDEIQSVETMKANGDLNMKPEDLTEQQWAALKSDLTNYYKRYESIYTTTVANETDIPINIPQYNTLTILEVYIEGRMLNRNEYTVNGTNSITLTTPLSEIGTKVHFIVYKSVCVTNEDYNLLKGEPGDSGALIFDTVSSMKTDETLVAGNTCQTLGYYAINDGGEALYKIVDDKFVVDFKEIINDINNISHVENINQHIKKFEIKGKEKSKSLNYNITDGNEGHMILKIKFFKFLNNNDLSKTQRQIEVIRTFSYIDIKDDEGDNYLLTSAGNNKNNSVYFFKKMIQSITNYDLDKFSEISSNLTDILRDIFSIPNLYSFIFGLINEFKDDLDKSLKTLNLLDICKNIDHDKFYMKLYQMNLSISRIENKALKQDFQILNLIFGEMAYYLEKTFKKLNGYFQEVKDIELKEKFFYLKQWLIKNGYNFQKNDKFCIILENTLGYIKNRAQWMQLMKAKNMIMKLTEGLKNMERNYSININNLNNKNK